MALLSEKLKFIPNWYEKLLKNGNEKILLAQHIKSNFLKKNVNSILEIGMGTLPVFSSVLSQYVKNYIVIEKQPTNVELPENTQLIEGDFEITEIGSKFDLAILSHVIYYFNNLHTSIQKVMSLLEEQGKAVFVVNGTGNDYGETKHAFAEITNTNFEFTYDLLLSTLKELNLSFVEHSIETSISFDTYDGLYESLQLFFDLFPEEFLLNKDKIVQWLKENIKGSKFHMDQKIIVIEKKS